MDQLWFRHPQKCWALGAIKQMYRDGVELRYGPNNEIYRVQMTETHPFDLSHLEDNDDIANMNNMHEGPLLSLLERRYDADKIYTFTGDILISINPYKMIDGLYTIADVFASGLSGGSAVTAPRAGDSAAPVPFGAIGSERVPHVYTVAERAYRKMLSEPNPSRRNQSMIVSGESGAGKTEACKHIMRYLASLSQRSNNDSNASEGGASIEERVLGCNPFLEAFGNAKTLRNDNSSRFGKFTSIEYAGPAIRGARLRHFLLEKARVVSPHEGERNYHIFYQLCRGVSEEERKELRLLQAEDYQYLIQGGESSSRIDGVDDAEEFALVRQSFTTVGINKEVQMTIFRLLSGLLMLGNVTFDVDPSSSSGEGALITNPEIVQVSADLLGCPMLGHKLVKRMVKVRGRASAYEVHLTPRQAMVTRDSLVKTVYERLFSWLIQQCNKVLSPDAPTASRSAKPGRPNKVTAFIGILDIFGFEIFDVNSFEQLCINYANEKLQSLFNHHIFVMEQELYKLEGVDVSNIEFANNQHCVSLIESKPFGILPLLDELCFLGRENSTDEEYLARVEKANQGKNQHYIVQKKKSFDSFTIGHFAGEVTYCVTGFMEKNNDTLYTDLEELMRFSNFNFVTEVFAATDERTPSQSSTSTIASKFRIQLNDLYETLVLTSPHYVRCVKPNNYKSADLFEHEMVLNQLLYAGVLETVRIRRQGYPFRETYLEFWRRAHNDGFVYLVDPSKRPPPPPPANYVPDGSSRKLQDASATPEVVAEAREGTILLCSAVLPEGSWALGHTKIFLKDSALAAILLAFRTRYAIVIQSAIRMFLARKKFLRARQLVIRVQHTFRGIVLRRKFLRMTRQITLLQACVRSKITRKRYLRLLQLRDRACERIQATARMFLARRRYKRIHHAFSLMQAYWRSRAAKMERMRRLNSVFVIARVAKGMLARRRARLWREQQYRAATKIQAAYRGLASRRNIRRWHEAATKMAAVFRGHMVRCMVARLYRCVYQLQHWYRGRRLRRLFKMFRKNVVLVQSWWRGAYTRLCLKIAFMASSRITRGIRSRLQKRVLTLWLQDLYQACLQGDLDQVRYLEECSGPGFDRLQHIPVADRLQIRYKAESYRAPLHAAVASGNKAVVEHLLSHLVDPLPVDRTQASPIHLAVVLGDSHLPVLKQLVEHVCGCDPLEPLQRNQPIHTLPAELQDALNRITISGESPLDAAIRLARTPPGGFSLAIAATGACSYGSRTARARAPGPLGAHVETVEYLLLLGAKSMNTGLSKERLWHLVRATKAIQQQWNQTHGAAGVSGATGSSGALESSLSAPTSPAGPAAGLMPLPITPHILSPSSAANNDPHFQLLLVAEQERQARLAAASKAVATPARAAPATTPGGTPLVSKAIGSSEFFRSKTGTATGTDSAAQALGADDRLDTPAKSLGSPLARTLLSTPVSKHLQFDGTLERTNVDASPSQQSSGLFSPKSAALDHHPKSPLSPYFTARASLSPSALSPTSGSAIHPSLSQAIVSPLLASTANGNNNAERAKSPERNGNNTLPLLVLNPTSSHREAQTITSPRLVQSYLQKPLAPPMPPNANSIYKPSSRGVALETTFSTANDGSVPYGLRVLDQLSNRLVAQVPTNSTPVTLETLSVSPKADPTVDAAASDKAANEGVSGAESAGQSTKNWDLLFPSFNRTSQDLFQSLQSASATNITRSMHPEPEAISNATSMVTAFDAKPLPGTVSSSLLEENLRASSTAQAPAPVSVPAPATPAPSATGSRWVRYVSKSTGLPYWYDTVTGVSQWSDPEAGASVPAPFTPEPVYTTSIRPSFTTTPMPTLHPYPSPTPVFTPSPARAQRGAVSAATANSTTSPGTSPMGSAERARFATQAALQKVQSLQNRAPTTLSGYLVQSNVGSAPKPHRGLTGSPMGAGIDDKASSGRLKLLMGTP